MSSNEIDFPPELYAIAYRLSDPEVTQKDLADELGISAASVSRLKQDCIDSGLIVVESRHTLSEKQIGEANLLLSAPRVEKKLAAIASRANQRVKPRVFVFHTKPLSHLDDIRYTKWDEALELFGRAVARTVRNQLSSWLAKKQKTNKQAKVIAGVTWGRALWELSEGMEKLERVKQPDFEFVPLVGEPVSNLPFREASKSEDRTSTDRYVHRLKLSSSYLAAKFNYLTRGSVSGSKSLRGIMGAVPRVYEENEIEDVKAFVRRLPPYLEIFGDDLSPPDEKAGSALCWEVDCILASIGWNPKKSTKRFWYDEFLHTILDRDEQKSLQKKEGIVGDVGLVFVTKRNGDHPVLDNLERRWMGANREHLRHCAMLAEKGEALGTMCFGIGVERSETIIAAVKEGLISQLYIDWNTAQQLLGER